MPRHRVIVVGAGNISRAWFPALAAERVEVAAVVDPAEDRAAAAIEQHGLARAVAGTDLAKVLREVPADFAVDLTPPEVHCRVTTAALGAGLHVLGEKPMAPSMAQARRMLRAAERTGRLYMVSQSSRWEPGPATIRRTVATGRIGPLTTVNCDFYIAPHFDGFRTQMESPLILDMAIHHFDLARMMSGLDPVTVWCDQFNPEGSWYAGSAAANAVFEMTGGARFVYRGSWCAEGCSTGWHGHWRLVGRKGTLLYETDAEPHGEVVAGRRGFCRPTRPLRVVRATSPHVRQHGALREFLACLRRGKAPQCECHDNIKSLAMVLAAARSSRLGRRIAVPAT